MGYGNPRRRREQDTGIRDMVEDAAREAGLSVEAFLDQAVSAHEEDLERRRRPAPRRPLRVVDDEFSPLDGLERRLSRNARPQDDISEDRIARILGRAFDEIRASEERTAALIETIGRAAPAQPSAPAAAAQPRIPTAVAEVLAGPERREPQARNVVDLHPARPAAEPPAERDGSGFHHALSSMNAVVANLQGGIARQEVEKALQLLERKLQLTDPQSVEDQIVLQGMASEIAAIRAVVLAEGAMVPLAAIEQPITSLTARINAMAAAQRTFAGAPASPQTPSRVAQSGVAAIEKRLDEVAGATSAMIAGIHDELTRLGQNGLQRNGAALDASFGRLDSRIHQLEQTARAPLEQVRQDLQDLKRMQEQTQTRFGLGGSAEAAQLRQSIGALEAKFDRLSGRIAQPLQMVHNAVTQLSRNQSESRADSGRLDQVFAELSALKRGLLDQNSAAAGAELQRQIGDISERIEAMALRMQQNAQPNGPRDLRRKSVDEEIAEIKRLISEAKSPCDDTAVLEAIAHLERKIAALENSPQALMERLDRLQQQLEERPAPVAAPAAPLPPNLELLLRNLALRLEAPPPASMMDDAGLDRLHEEIRQLGSRLEQAPLGSALQPAAQDLSAVERSISDLFRQIDGIKTEVGNHAARAAADAVRAFAPTPAPAAPVVPDTSHLDATLGQLRTAQAEAEQRTTRTLEALHDTLQRVVERLGSMEHDARPPAAPAPAPAVFAPQPPPQAFTPVTFEPPVMQAPAPRRTPPPAVADADASDLLPADILVPQPPRQAQAPVAAPAQVAPEPAAKPSFSETLAMLRSGQAAAGAVAAETPAKAESKSAVASAFAAARGAMANLRATRGETAPPVAAATADAPLPSPREAAPAAAASAAPPVELDLPLEPGSGRPRPGQAAPAAAADPKADFLAAARRAAQSAALQSAEALSQNDPRASLRKGKDGRAAEASAAGTPAGAGAGFRAKHAILLGLAALLVVAGAGYQFMGGQKRADSPVVSQPPARTSTLAPSTRPDPAPAPRQQQAEAPRQILPPVLASETQRPVAAATPAAPAATAAVRADEPQTVGSIAPQSRLPASAPPPIAADDQLLRFEGLRDGEKLKEAARRGDPSAFIELAMRYSEGRGAVRDPKTAALWLERAADAGSPTAQYRLGAMHREGRGVERNAKTALRHFTAAAEAGNARAMHNTAVLLAEGVTGAPDYAGASNWFKKAAEFGIRDSQYNLAILYARGLGVGQDLTASYAWFAAAAANGDEDALKKRDEVGARLSAERLQQARTAAAQWKPRTPDPASNEVSVPAGGWDSEAKQVPAGAGAAKAAPKRG